MDKDAGLTPPTSDGGVRYAMHPVLMMLLILLATVGLTYVVDAGDYARAGQRVLPGTYQPLAKPIALADLVMVGSQPDGQAHPASLFTIVTMIPPSMARAAPLIFMIMFIGGMFGVLKSSGALDAGVERLLVLARGNIYLLAPGMMLLIACGSSFLGMISEYLLILPMMVALFERLKLTALHAVGLVTISAKIGFLASVTNPIALGVAQPLLGLPLLSGAGLRFAIFVLYLAIGMLYLLHHVRRAGYTKPVGAMCGERLSRRHLAVLLTLGACVLGMLAITRTHRWDILQLGSFYIAVSILLAPVAGLSSHVGIEAFLNGMKGMVLPGLLVGLAETVRMILEGSHVFDTIIYRLAGLVEGSSPALVGVSMIAAQMLLDVLIPSTSGKAAISMPVFGPIGELSGLSGQCVLLAFLFGNGLTNMITPTSGMLLAYLATAGVRYGAWARFILPLVLLLTVLSIFIMVFAVRTGYR